MIVFLWTEITICVYNLLRVDVALILGVEKLTKEPRYVSIYLLFICSHGIRCLHRMSTLTSFDEVQLTFNNWLINHEREKTLAIFVTHLRSYYTATWFKGGKSNGSIPTFQTVSDAALPRSISTDRRRMENSPFSSDIWSDATPALQRH